MSEKLDREIPGLLNVIDIRDAMQNFKKKYYEDFFFSYRDSVSEINEEIVKMYDSEDPVPEMESAALSLVSYARKQRDSAIFFRRTAVLTDLQCMMVFYVLPCLLKNPPVERSKEFTDIICSKWNEAFPKSTIGAAGFDEIYNGFRTTIFGFNVEGMFGDKGGKK